MIVDKLHQHFENMQDLRTRDIRVDKRQRKVFCTISYPEVSSLDRNLRSQIVDYVKSILPRGYNCILTFANDSFTEISFRHFVRDLLKTKYPLFANVNKERIVVKIVGRNVSVTFLVSAVTKRSMELAEFLEQLSQFFAAYTCYNVTFSAQIDENIVSNVDIAEQEKLIHLAVNRELLKPSRYFSVDNVQKHIGKVILSQPMYIADIRKPSDSCVICGTISQKTSRVSKNNPNMHICSFVLTDESGGSLNCIIFVKCEIADVKIIQETTGKTENESLTISRTKQLANEKKLRKIMDIYEGMQVVVRGRIALNNFSERLEMTVFDMCKCTIAPLSNFAAQSRSVPASYLVVKPEVYEEYAQISFVQNNKGATLQLSGKNYVVLHANVTGYNPITDKILAICGVKVTNGNVTERLFTYVNPEMSLEESLIKPLEIEQEKLVFFPTVSELICDLYKFTYGAELVGTDVAQLLELLNYYATPVGYNFANKCIDQVEMLTQLFENSLFGKTPNCAKLNEVAKLCKVECVNPVFCKNSALTVARCLHVLSNNGA